MTNKQAIISALASWIKQRPGLEYGNYGDPVSYRAELRSITRDLQDARTLLRAVELSGITGEELAQAFDRAYSGRLSWNGARLDYCTGQYWPTEYRRAACAVLASALWGYHRDNMPAPRYQVAGKGMAWPTLEEAQQSAKRYAPAIVSIEKVYRDKAKGAWVSPGAYLRGKCRELYGRGIQSRWFN
jgi:hypothetical protein